MRVREGGGEGRKKGRGVDKGKGGREKGKFVREGEERVRSIEGGGDGSSSF